MMWTEELPQGCSVHGGADAMGVPRWDFSTNSNAAGPCPQTLEAVRQASFEHYPDPTYVALRERLAAYHGVAPWRIVPGASASELIARITADVAATQHRAAVWMPEFHYGDYTRAALTHGMPQVTSMAQADLIWLCAPTSPLGQVQPWPEEWTQRKPDATVVLDCAYAPLQLTQVDVTPGLDRDAVWQLWTPNKALGLCGVRAGYAIAPAHEDRHRVQGLLRAAPSWPLGAAGVALLESWCQPETQAWLEAARDTLRRWKVRQINCLQMLGLEWLDSETNFGVVRLPWPLATTSAADEALTFDVLQLSHEAGPVLSGLAPKWEEVQSSLRRRGVKLRDCTSFGLPGCVRVCVHTPEAQDALAAAWLQAMQEVHL